MERFGVDRPVVYAVIGRAIYVASAPVTLLLIQRFLSPELQGFHFTFGSLLALSMVVELGFSQVLLFFASHERSQLTWSERGLLEGEGSAKARLASLLRLALRWYAVVAALVLVLLVPAGLTFFADGSIGGDLVWREPWVLAVFATAGTCLISPLFAILEGCGLVAEVEAVRLGQMVAGTLAMWAMLVAGGALLATGATALVSVGVGATWLFVRRRGAILDLLRTGDNRASLSWRRELWPMQWRMALSWLAGWFVFQMMTPVVFQYQGAAEAGRFGMTMALSNALVSVGSAWTNTRAAALSQHAARREYARMDETFSRMLRSSVGLVTLGAIAVVAGVITARLLNLSIADRLLAPTPTAALMGAAIANQAVFAQAVYLRAHRREPLLGVTLVLGVAVAVTTSILAPLAGVSAVALGYFVLTVVVFLGGSTFVFLAKRREWHQDEATDASDHSK